MIPCQNETYRLAPFLSQILNAPGESNMEGYSGYITNRTLPGLIAQATNGAVGTSTPVIPLAQNVLTSLLVFLEHRCFGKSNPYPDLKDSTLKYLSVEQAIEGASGSARSKRRT
jgi:hypothetical protein